AACSASARSPCSEVSDAATLTATLRKLFPEASGRSLKQWLESGRVELNGRVCRDGRVVVSVGDRVVLGTRGRVPFPRGLGLVHEDADIVVVDKSPGLLSVASQRERERTAYRPPWDYPPAHHPPPPPLTVPPPHAAPPPSGTASIARRRVCSSSPSRRRPSVSSRPSSRPAVWSASTSRW